MPLWIFCSRNVKGCGSKTDYKEKMGTKRYARDGGVQEKACEDDGCNSSIENGAGDGQKSTLYSILLCMALAYTLH